MNTKTQKFQIGQAVKINSVRGRKTTYRIVEAKNDNGIWLYGLDGLDSWNWISEGLLIQAK